MYLKVGVHVIDVIKHVLDYPWNDTLHLRFTEGTLFGGGGGIVNWWQLSLMYVDQLASEFITIISLSLSYLHCMRLPTRSLSICKYGSVVAT